MKSISCFLPYQDDTATRSTVRQLTCSPLVEKIYLLVPADKKEPQISSCASIRTNDLWSSETIRTIAEHSTTEFILIYTQGDALKLGPFALDRLATLASETNAGLGAAICVMVMLAAGLAFAIISRIFKGDEITF